MKKLELSPQKNENANVVESNYSRKGSVASVANEEDLYAVVPPNGGWGWFIVICAFYCSIVVDGIQLTFGVFLKPISKDLDAEYSQVAFAGSLMFGIHLLMGPVCCGFNSAFGLRPVTITGSLICSFGIGISYFSPNYWCLCITYGVIGGFGLGLVYMNLLVITSLYFTTLLPAAIAVVVSGTGVGTMIFAGMSNTLVESTTWQTSFLMLSAMAGSMAIVATAFKPLKPIKVRLSFGSRTSLSRTSSDMDPEKNKAILIKTEIPKSESYNSMATIQTAVRGFVERVISSEFIRSDKKWCKSECRGCRKKKEQEYLVLSEVRNSVERNTDTRRSYVEKVRSEKEGEKEDDILPANRVHSSVSYNTVFTRIEIPNENTKVSIWSTLKKTIIFMLDCKLLGSFNFFLFAIIGAFHLASFLIVLIYEKARAEDLGFKSDMSVYFIIAIGASNVFWRLFLGGIALIPGVNYVALSCSAIILGGLGTAFSGFNAHILYHFAFCFLFALGMGSFAVFRMPFLVEMVGSEKIENATGINLLFMGVFSIISPPFFGWVLKLVKNFKIMFLGVGLTIIAGGFLQLLVKRRVSYKNKRTPRK